MRDILTAKVDNYFGKGNWKSFKVVSEQECFGMDRMMYIVQVTKSSGHKEIFTAIVLQGASK